jgi:DNA repair exonuclease SbcCD ATPase subunit
MTPEGRSVFFSSTPRLRARAGFTVFCSAKEKKQILGCYVNGKIFILRVNRPELATVMEVTAAHEMLHAAYDRLSADERRRIDGLTRSFYAASKDPELKEIVERYPEAERVNELHSLLGTQVADLDGELERYYRQYFGDRSRVVAAHAQSDEVFDVIEARHAQLLAEINSIAAEIDELVPQQEAAVAEAKRLSDQIEALRAQNRIEESNRLVAQQNAATDRATALRAKIVLLTNDHNGRVREINDLVFRQDQLVRSLGAG